jgi:hypothetical protein
MARSQFDYLDEEKRNIATLLSRFNGLVLSVSKADPYSPTNLYVVEDGRARLNIEITHKNPEAFCQIVVSHAVKQFAAGDFDLCRLTC